MPQMRRSQKSAHLRQFLRQDFKEKLGLPPKRRELDKSLDLFRPLVKGGRYKGGSVFYFPISFILLCLCLSACTHFPDALPEPRKATQVFEADERVILKAITRVLKDRGFGEPQIEADKGRLETDYVIQGRWRTKVVATIKKIGRKEREVTLSLITEQKSFASSQWQPRNLMGKEHYDKFFREIEMQIYREWSKAE